MNKKDFNQMPKLAINFLLKTKHKTGTDGLIACLTSFFRSPTSCNHKNA